MVPSSGTLLGMERADDYKDCRWRRLRQAAPGVENERGYDGPDPTIDFGRIGNVDNVRVRTWNPIYQKRTDM
jgi:hypothetical protein